MTEGILEFGLPLATVGVMTVFASMALIIVVIEVLKRIFKGRA